MYTSDLQLLISAHPGHARWAVPVLKHLFDLPRLFKISMGAIAVLGLYGVAIAQSATAVSAESKKIAAAKMTDRELMTAPGSESVLMERLERKSIGTALRYAAVEELAKIRKTDRVTEAIAALHRFDRPGVPLQLVNDLGILLTAMPADASKARAELASLCGDSHQPPVRRCAYAALVSADGKPDALWAATATEPGSRAVLIDSIGMMIDPSVRATFQPLLESTITNANTPANVREAALHALPLMGTDSAGRIFAILAAQLRQGENLSAAARAIKQLPRSVWVKAEAATASEAILSWARSVPETKRGSQEYAEAVQVGIEMADLLKPEDAARVRKELFVLGVRLFVISAMREQMRYDTPRIVVEAGKPFEIVFQNGDLMPHNFVVVAPGGYKEVAEESEEMELTPDKQGRICIPDNKKILFYSQMIEPGQKEALKLEPLATPGDYNYVCTYPEHAKTMFGHLLVVNDVEDFLRIAAAPAQPHAALRKDPICTTDPTLIAAKRLSERAMASLP